MTPSDESILLTQPWQIRLYQLQVQRNYCRQKARGWNFRAQRTLKSFNQEYGTTCRTWAAMEEELSKIIEAMEEEHGVRPKTP